MLMLILMASVLVLNTNSNLYPSFKKIRLMANLFLSLKHQTHHRRHITRQMVSDSPSYYHDKS